MAPQDRFDHRDDLEGRSPFGISPQDPRRELAVKSKTWQDAAFNLADKALRKLLARDDAGAWRLIDRLAALDFDEFEGEWPQLLAADQLVFNVLAQQVEAVDAHDGRVVEAEYDGDFEAAEDEPPVAVSTGILKAAVGADPGAAASLRASIGELLSTPWEWGLGGAQIRRLEWAADKLPEGTRARDISREMSRDELATMIRAHLDLAMRMAEEFYQP